MIAYRFLLPAEEEMTDASIFYENASRKLGSDFLDDVQHAIDIVRAQPLIGRHLEQVCEGYCSQSFRSVLSIHLSQTKSSSSRLRIRAVGPTIGENDSEMWQGEGAY
jgi:hypothetical protein